ncbi:YkgJ family cysteine cluster protein [Anaerovorax odorimutans]|uniref:YkgJ family cysteine cluster protein n=1 Tax=Anaerovorax odorimutans TaxID=109327 RepID=UPI000409C5CF|nr:YkgJ family cysteine cluster protein [Anaerovorax odorimutans]
MLKPSEVNKAAKVMEADNLRFRSFLKNHADEEELDKQFLVLHNELFADYDCRNCRNCCKMYKGTFQKYELEKAAGYLNITTDQFIDFFLEFNEIGCSYETKHKPCDFLDEVGNCKLGDMKPESCKTYPYTNQPERLWSLANMLNVVEVCPVAFEIFERLKRIYRFKNRRRY